MDTSEIAVKTGDKVEIVLLAKVAAVQAIQDGGTILYFEETDGDETLGYVAPIYLGEKSAVQALTVITPAKPKLDLNGLPVGTVLQGLGGDRIAPGVYVKAPGQAPDCWAGVDGRYHTSADLLGHDELIELVRRDALA